MSSASKLFIACLATTALTAITDLITVQLLTLDNVPLWANMLANSAYFVINIITTSTIALYLFTKLLEHTHHQHCMRRACIGLVVLFVVYMAFVLDNYRTGWLFYFVGGTYCRGPLNSLGYIVTLGQMVLVIICYLRNRQNASRLARRALLQTFPLVPLCILIHRVAPDIMLNAFVMAMVLTVLFLTFMGQRQGVHALTRLNDRHRFFSEVNRLISKKESFHIFLINIKDFSAINQKYGHLFGDEYLYQFAFTLDKLFKGALSFHMNGTVFAMILPYTHQNTAEEQCGILLDFLEGGIRCGEEQITTNYVVSHYIANGKVCSATELYEIMEYAAAKVYTLKHHYIRCSGEDIDEMERRRYLREHLQNIDREHGFEVWFQPIQCLKTGEFCSMEALIRLRESDGSMISPAEFIPLAEQTGHINSITWFVLEEVCRILKSHPELKNTSVSINLPMAQLLEKGFIPRFTSTINQAGIDHHQICIEFTERAILENFQQIKSIMEHLTQDGFRFYLDDFGSGYSNFNCVLQLPFQIIKLDRCLVTPETNGPSNYAMVHTLTSLLHEMGLVVIAEGAETQQDVQALTNQGVDRIQGFALALPMSEENLLQFYREHPVSP